MNQETYQKLIDDATKISNLWHLEETEKEWLFPLLSPRIKTALRLLEAIKETEKSYKEIAEEIGIHPTTAQQITNALAEGGVKITENGKGAIAYTGRPFKLKKVDIEFKNV